MLRKFPEKQASHIRKTEKKTEKIEAKLACCNLSEKKKIKNNKMKPWNGGIAAKVSDIKCNSMVR